MLITLQRVQQYMLLFFVICSIKCNHTHILTYFSHTTGYNREKWILNPGAVSPIQLEMFSFLGKLMGIAVRTKEYLPLNIPSIIWCVHR